MLLKLVPIALTTQTWLHINPPKGNGALLIAQRRPPSALRVLCRLAMGISQCPGTKKGLKIQYFLGVTNEQKFIHNIKLTLCHAA
jgi:hypothetical protein